MKKIIILFILVSSISFSWFQYDVGMMTGGVKGTYIKFGVDTMDLMKRYNMLVRPIVSYGSQINLVALKKSRGVDLAIVQADVLSMYRRKAEFDRNIRKMIRNFRYITKLYNEEVHILTYRGSGIKNLSDIDGKIVNIGSVGSGTEMTAKIIMNKIGIAPRKLEHLKADKAIDALKEKRIDVAFFVGGKPLGYLKNNLQGLQFVQVTDNNYFRLSNVYQRALLTHDDYGNIPIEKEVNTLAVPSILACYNWPRSNRRRYRSITAFMRLLYEYRDILAFIGEKKGNYKWRDINFNDTVPGWIRHPYMECLIRNSVESCE